MSNQTNQQHDDQDPRELNYLVEIPIMPLFGDDQYDYHRDIQTCNSVSELRQIIRVLPQLKPDLIPSAMERLSELENQKLPASSSQQTQGEERQRRPTQRERETLLFPNVLLSYIRNKDKKMYEKAKAITKEYSTNLNRLYQPGFESVTAAMESRLKDLVGDHYWNRAKFHFSKHAFGVDNRKQRACHLKGTKSGSSSVFHEGETK